MKSNKKIYTKLQNGEKLEYDVVLTFLNNENKKYYVIYTDNSIDQFSKIRFYVAVYDPKLPNPYIGEPNSQEEWLNINNVLTKIIPSK